jgi:hypothetical protein
VQCSAVQCTWLGADTYGGEDDQDDSDVRVQPSLEMNVGGSAVQCSAVQCSAVQCSAVQCSAVHLHDGQAAVHVDLADDHPQVVD